MQCTAYCLADYKYIVQYFTVFSHLQDHTFHMTQICCLSTCKQVLSCDSWRNFWRNSYFFFFMLEQKTTCGRAVFVFHWPLYNRVLSGHILTPDVSVGFEVLAGNHIISCQRQQWKWTRAPWWRNDFMNGWQRSHQMAELLCFWSSSLLRLAVEASRVQDLKWVIYDSKYNSPKLTTTALL